MIDEVYVSNYKSVLSLRLLLARVNVFIGGRGSGKTNILEALYLLSFGSSFRTRKDEHFLRHGAGEMALEGKFSAVSGEQTDILLKTSRGHKEIRLDGKAVKDRRQIIGRFPCIIFCHDDITYITGTPDRQRIFFNQTLSLKDPLFLDVLGRYTRALKQRNAALREKNSGVARLFDEELVIAGLQISRMRRELADEFSVFFARLFSEIFEKKEQPGDAGVKIRYLPSWRGEDAGEVMRTLNEKSSQDILFSTTTTGPHRDRFRFFLREKDFCAAASTGQIRLASLILRAAQAEFFLSRSGRKPILLLDDVLLEMDPDRRKRFLEHLPPCEQAFFTFLPDEQFHSYRKTDTLVYKVRGGRVESV